MLQRIDGKPTRVLCSSDLSALCINAAFRANHQKDYGRFLIPGTKDGISTRMDDTFYLVCPYFCNQTRQAYRDLLSEMKKRSRLAAIIFPHNTYEWTDLLVEVGFYDLTANHNPLSNSSEVAIFNSSNNYMGPGDYFLQNHVFTEERSIQLLQLADEYYNTTHERWNLFGKSYLSKYSYAPPNFRICNEIAKQLCNAAILEELLDSPLTVPTKKPESKRDPEIRAKPCRKNEESVAKKVVCQQGFDSLDQIKAELNRKKSNERMLLATRKLLVAYSPEGAEYETLIELCDTPKVYLDKELHCVIAPASFYKLFSLLLSGAEIKL